MPFKRRPYPAVALAVLMLAILCSLAAALSILPQGDTPLYVHLYADNISLDSGAANVTISGFPAEYMFNGTYIAMVSLDDMSCPFDVRVEYGINNYTQTFDGLPDCEEDVVVNVPMWVAGYTVTGKIYTGDGNWLTPWSDESIVVTVNGIPATMEGENYTAVLAAPPEADADVKVTHECGYLLSEKMVPLNASSNATTVDMVVRPLIVNGDVYLDGSPADGATVFIYVNDRPYEPITTEAVYDEDGTLSRPMFHALLPGAHPGDRLQLMAALHDRTGIVTQDAQDYPMFLTINLKDVDLNVM